MIFAIDNYLTSEDTQCIFLNKNLNDLDDHTSILFDSARNSIYDTFDEYKPDVYITHGNKISNDLIHYLKYNNHKIDVLVNIHKMSKENLSIMQDVLLKQTNSSFFFTCEPTKQQLRHNVIQISNCADSNLQNIKSDVEYAIEKAVIYYAPSEIKKYEGTYHNVGINKIDGVDFILPQLKLSPIFKNYSQAIFRNLTTYIPQGFFDAIFTGLQVYYDIDNKDNEQIIEAQIDKLFKPTKSLNYKDQDRLTDFSAITKVVEDKHTDKNRTRTLLSNLRKT